MCWKFYPEKVLKQLREYSSIMRGIDQWRKSLSGKTLMQKAREQGVYDRPDELPDLTSLALSKPQRQSPTLEPTPIPAPGYLPASQWISLEAATPVTPDDIVWDPGGRF